MQMYGLIYLLSFILKAQCFSSNLHLQLESKKLRKKVACEYTYTSIPFVKNEKESSLYLTRSFQFAIRKTYPRETFVQSCYYLLYSHSEFRHIPIFAILVIQLFIKYLYSFIAQNSIQAMNFMSFVIYIFFCKYLEIIWSF